MQELPTILVIGEILLDVFPTYTRIGGAPFNFAYHLDKCGFPVRFVSRIGKDEHGQRVIKTLADRDFDAATIQHDEHHATGIVDVTVDNEGVPEFDIVPDVAYDHIQFDAGIHQPILNRARLIYFGTLAQRSREGFESLHQFLEHRHPDAQCFYDINLRPTCYSEKYIRKSLEHANVLKLNKDELQVCKKMFGYQEDDRAFITHLMEQYRLSMLALTDGGHGSTLFSSEGYLSCEPHPVVSMVDTVGAGDGFAAMLAAGRLLNWPVASQLSRASEFASRICSIKGAISDSTNFYDTCRNLVSGGE
jgi:fructokinase